MDWARDHLGNDIPAWQGGISSYGLVCPSCGEPVYRRAGRERQPHFAHYSQRAKPECANYFPASGYQPDQHSASDHGKSPTQAERSLLNCGLFLGSSTTAHGLQLRLRIPPLITGQEPIGELRIHGGLGLRSYLPADLTQARLISLRPELPLGSCTGSGAFLPLAMQINAELGMFRHEGNLFYADERGGRLVFPNEPLEWGTSYRLLTSATLSPPPELQALLSWQTYPMLAEWYLYELSLPTTFAASGMVPEKISEFFGKKIRNARPRLFIVDPLPHHIEADGTYVYPEDPVTLLIRRSAPKRVDAAGSLVPPTFSEISDELVLLERIGTNGAECVVSIDGDEQAVFRVEPCELFRPNAVTAHCGVYSWELTTPPPIDDLELDHLDVSVECKNERLAMHIAKLNPEWAHDGLALTSPKVSEKALRAGSFGYLQTRASLHVIANQADEYSCIDARQSATKVWVEGLVMATFGQDGLHRVRRYFADSNPNNKYHLGTLISSSLMPYIRTAHDHQEE